MGSLVDVLLLTPNTFDEEYCVNDAATPSDAIKNIIVAVYASFKEIEFIDLEIEIINQCNNFKYRQKSGNEVKLKFIYEHWDYFKLLQNSENKTVISIQELEDAKRIVSKLTDDPTISKLFLKEKKNIKVSNQEEIYWEFEGIPLKSLLDMITINEKNKTIQPWDLKTTGFIVSDFKNSFYKFRYDFQAAFYTAALKFKYPDYTILPFRFVVVGTKYNDAPRIFECSEKVLEIGLKGNDKYKGWLEAIELLKYHAKKNIWNDTKDNIERGEIIQLTE